MDRVVLTDLGANELIVLWKFAFSAKHSRSNRVVFIMWQVSNKRQALYSLFNLISRQCSYSRSSGRVDPNPGAALQIGSQRRNIQHLVGKETSQPSCFLGSEHGDGWMLRFLHPAAVSGRYETPVKLADKTGTHYRGTSFLVEWTCMKSDLVSQFRDVESSSLV